MIEQIELELAQLPEMEGIILSEITDLPDSIRSIVSKMVQHRSMSIQEMMAIFQAERTEAHRLSKLFVDKGILLETKQHDESIDVVDALKKELTYTLRFARNRRPQLVSKIWDSFDEL